MFFKFIFLSLISCYLYAYELPQLDNFEKDQPKIIIFEAKSILVKEKLSYEVMWETFNTTDVHISYFGKIEHSGKIVVTEDEYNRGPITLTASNSKSNKTVSKTINKQKGGLENTTFIKSQQDTQKQYYNTMPYTQGMRRARRPYRRPYY